MSDSRTEVEKLQATIDELTVREKSWRRRAQDNAAQRDTYRHDADMWQRRARENLAVIKAHESTIKRFIDKLDDILNEE